jgi:hypothetical protein
MQQGSRTIRLVMGANQEHGPLGQTRGGGQVCSNSCMVAGEIKGASPPGAIISRQPGQHYRSEGPGQHHEWAHPELYSSCPLTAIMQQCRGEHLLVITTPTAQSTVEQYTMVLVALGHRGKEPLSIWRQYRPYNSMIFLIQPVQCYRLPELPDPISHRA